MYAWLDISERVGIPFESCIKRCNIKNFHFPAVVFFSVPATKMKDSTVKIAEDLMRPYGQLNGVQIQLQILREHLVGDKLVHCRRLLRRLTLTYRFYVNQALKWLPIAVTIPKILRGRDGNLWKTITCLVIIRFNLQRTVVSVGVKRWLPLVSKTWNSYNI